ncbi:hypothetical protein BO70DRAFT_326797 [Aspergillus heteromorphus CBS 117.55]|uniref:Uncharacterized protein n=1 Tax=Aspergillus heteromorphus CBS 117.55 TaxID=1448321 RepID=A0A317X0C0_9EURO|nr:uncharacterized protein BO70DRAFT_326797 [Aspergillus heteromorphus CBS 117.55]PWY92003.1 hypothetical protein BO70DRAFT_326797 [Aspergillus heteromorphus CBS 117.55]
MCGPSRSSTGNLIAIIFPSPPSSSLSSSSPNTSYALSFEDTEHPNSKTKATFRIPDMKTLAAFQASMAVEVRIERHGDLTSQSTLPPLYHFRIPAPGTTGKQKQTGSGCEGGEFEVFLPERLELGISERGIVGRQVGVVLEGVDVDVDMGRGSWGLISFFLSFCFSPCILVALWDCS